MSAVTEKLFTTTLTAGTLIIDETYGLHDVSLILQSGTGSILGNRVTTSGIVSSAIPLNIGQPINISSDNSSALIDYLEITTSGVVAIIGR